MKDIGVDVSALTMVEAVDPAAVEFEHVGEVK